MAVPILESIDPTFLTINSAHWNMQRSNLWATTTLSASAEGALSLWRTFVMLEALNINSFGICNKENPFLAPFSYPRNIAIWILYNLENRGCWAKLLCWGILLIGTDLLRWMCDHYIFRMGQICQLSTINPLNCSFALPGWFSMVSRTLAALSSFEPSTETKPSFTIC